MDQFCPEFFLDSSISHRETVPSINIVIQCFCGKSGNWYDRMLECQRCKCWFHETCLGCLHYKLICGDRFYLYVCEYCNSGSEFLHRLPLNWENIVHLAIWNLSKSRISMGKNGQYFEYKEQITLWVNHYWELLQCPPELKSIPIKDRTQCILLALNGNSTKFKCGREARKKNSLWGLRYTDPPSVLEIILPPESPFTETLMHRIRYCDRTTEFCPIPKSFKIDTGLPGYVDPTESPIIESVMHSIRYCERTT
ncbi:unnamed protein product [Meganyctiphanes norvegica]|uniref:Uncharacterized protein n=1 Tax=Meganyctiphanes norvegica TaxID=48144 RepID=A0AAV2RNC2_MEGNR